MRNISAAKSVASSPPVPARISSTTFFSSLGSLGTSSILSSFSVAASRSSRRVNSSCAYAFSSASDSSLIIALLSSIPRCRSLYSRYFSTISESSLCAFAVFWYFDESLITSGDARARVSSSYRDSIWFKRSNMLCPYCSPSPNNRVIGSPEHCQNRRNCQKMWVSYIHSWQSLAVLAVLAILTRSGRGPHYARFHRLFQEGHIGLDPRFD